MRLYVYPQLVLFSAGYTVHIINKNNDVFYFFFNVMLWLLLCLNIMWFQMMLNLMYRIGTGRMEKVEDIREEDCVMDRRNIHQKEGQNHVSNGHAHYEHANGNGVVGNHREEFLGKAHEANRCGGKSWIMLST